MPHKLPAWSPLWREYPDYFFHPSSAKVKKEIGGSVDQNYLVNTCAIRLSRTLNYNGFPLTFSNGMKTKWGADKKRYAIRVRELTPWMRRKLGRPDFDQRKRAGEPFDKSQLAGMQGIIGFDIKFSDATGHLDLWTGTRFSSEHKMTRDYWSGATRIWLWRTGK